MTGDDYWFRPKRRGYGAGRPVAWQGWALTGGYTLIAAASGAFLLPVSAIGFAAVMIGATAAFLLISARKTEGGWRLRCGREAPAASSSRGRRNGEKGKMMFMKFHGDDHRKPLLIAMFTVLLVTGAALLTLL